MNNIKEILNKIKSNEIKYPELRQGETFIDGKIFLCLFSTNWTEVATGMLFDSLEDGVKYFGSLELKGDYYISCKEAKNPRLWKVNISF